MMYINEKEKAIKLRKEGKTYSEILKEIPVAKSTLSEWFRDVKLSKPEFQRLTQKKLVAARRGGEAKRKQRLERVKEIHNQALKDVTHISKRELWLIGIALYWAEGRKEKMERPGSQFAFSNSDPKMIKLFLYWLNNSCLINNREITFNIFIHKNFQKDISRIRKYWSEVTGYSVDKFNKVYYKKHKIKTNRKNVGNLYYGQIQVKVKSSSTLVRKVSGWVEAIYQRIIK